MVKGLELRRCLLLQIALALQALYTGILDKILPVVELAGAAVHDGRALSPVYPRCRLPVLLWAR